VAPGRPAVYVLRALAGQEMTVRADGPGPFMTILKIGDRAIERLRRFD
jgi:hypothetical protein